MKPNTHMLICIFGLILYIILTVVLLQLTACGLSSNDCQGDTCNKEDIVGPQGEPGPTGPVGPTGDSCTTENFDNGVMISCGITTSIIKNGNNGTSCQLHELNTGILVQCGNQAGVMVLNGTNGTSGKDGTDGVDGKDAPPINIITLCGSTQPHAEIAIHINDSWLVYFENNDGSSRRLTVLIPGQAYRSTDGIQTCTFTTEDLDKLR